jgi:plasmid maintenance system antidote protein VapI
MRVNNGYNPYQYQQQKNQATGTGFADLLASQTTKSSPSSGKTSRAATEDDGILHVMSKGGNVPFLLLGKHVDTSRKLNADSKGDQELTEEQILSLREKYDFKNLSMQDQYDLYCDLTDMGVLTVDEVQAIGISNISLRGTKVYSPPDENLFSRNQEIEFSQDSLQAWFLSLVEQEQSDYDAMLEIGEILKSDFQNKYDPSMKRAYESFEKNSSTVDRLMTQHKKVAEVLSLLGKGI